MAIFPTFPTSGKNSKVEVSTGDGPLLTLQDMTIQSTYEHEGEYYTDRIYLLGTGQTLINVRPAMLPEVNIDGVLEGIDCEYEAFTTSTTTLKTSAGVIEHEGTQVSVTAATALALTRPSASNWGWNLVVYDTTANAVEIVDGTATEVVSAADLLNTYGVGAGQKPLIDVDHILLNAIKIEGDTHAAIPPTQILATDREYGGVDYELLPNIGGVLLQRAMVKCHTGSVGRKVMFTGRYLDDLMVGIGTAKSWNLSSSTSETTESTFSGGFSQTEIEGWSFTFEQLAADKKVVTAAFKRQGHCAVRLIFPNGFGFQGVATVAPTINSQVGSMININVSGSFGAFPVDYTE